MKSQFPMLRALVWFDINKENNWLYDSSAASTPRFRPPGAACDACLRAGRRSAARPAQGRRVEGAPCPAPADQGLELGRIGRPRKRRNIRKLVVKSVCPWGGYGDSHPATSQACPQPYARSLSNLSTISAAALGRARLRMAEAIAWRRPESASKSDSNWASSAPVEVR